MISANAPALTPKAPHTSRAAQILSTCAGASLALSLVSPLAWMVLPQVTGGLMQALTAPAAQADELGVTVTEPVETAPEGVAREEQAPLAGERGTSSDAGVEAPHQEVAPEQIEVPDPSGGEVEEQATDGPVPRESDIPTGPDTTRAEETGMPVAGGTSSDPLVVLLHVVEVRQGATGASVASVDELAGVVSYA